MTPLHPAEATASEHFLAIHDENATPEALEAAIAWIESSPENGELFERVSRFWSACDRTADDVVGPTGPPARRLRTASGWWAARSFQPLKAASWLALPALIAALLVGGALLSERPGRRGPDVASTHLSTSVGEIRRVALADGSQVTLSGATHLTVRLDDKARAITLAQGEAFFDVAKDQARPFVVHTSTGWVQAIGTAFDVHRTSTGVTVTLARGAVSVGVKGKGGVQGVGLTPGQQVSYSSDGRLSEVRYVDLGRVLAWRGGSLYFVGRPLATVVGELNRYSPKPIVLDEASVGEIEVTGIVKIDGISDWLRGVASVTHVEVTESANEIYLSNSRGRGRSTVASRKSTP